MALIRTTLTRFYSSAVDAQLFSAITAELIHTVCSRLLAPLFPGLTTVLAVHVRLASNC